MKNLAEVPKNEQLEFINSFDHILCDLDGVVWLKYKAMPGAVTCLTTLKKLGKDVHYVSNNSTITPETLKNTLDVNGLTTNMEDIVVPILAIISYLKKINFNKEIYVIGADPLRETLRKAGFLVAVDVLPVASQTLTSLLGSLDDDENIGAVLVDIDINVHFLKMQKAITYLKRQDCLFLVGSGDARLPLPNDVILIGPHYYIKPLSDITGKQPYQLGKPHIGLNEFIVERFKITNPKRVLFVGDSVDEDLNLATKCGYQKLLVLSGVTKYENVKCWNYPEEYKPQYYIDSLKGLGEIINSCFSSVQKL